MKSHFEKNKLLHNNPRFVSRKGAKPRRLRKEKQLCVSFASLRLCVQLFDRVCRGHASILLTLLFFVARIETPHAQMLDPAIDRDDEPFCYFSQPTDVIGVMDGREGTLVTPEGYLCTGFGELMFFTGNPLTQVDQRVKTLLRGYLPVIQYQFEREGVRYQFTLFAATLDENPESPLMNFARVQMHNQSSQPRVAYFGVGTRCQNEANTDWGIGDNRFLRRVQAKILGEYEQAGAVFDPNWEYTFSGDAFLRDSLVMYLYPSNPVPQQSIVLKTGYNEVPELGAMRIPILPTTPVGIVKYKISLQPDEKQALDFKMPYEPLPPQSATVALLRSARFDDYLTRTINFWEEIFADGIDISLPEEKVVNSFKANLVYDLIARNKVDGHFIQKVNEFQYDSFWLRDASYIVRMYDVSGYHDIARQCLDFFLRWQKDDGNFVSQGGQYDGWGQTLWAFGQHYRMTRDQAFAEKIYPAVQKAFAWLQQARHGDPLRVMPVTTPGDNENISGHVTGHNFWALAGLKNAIALAEGLGRKEEAKSFQREYDDFRSTLVKHLKRITAKTRGYIPPGLEGGPGNDWGNMMAVYPEIFLDPFDPMVTATLHATRAKYQEGIMTYENGRYLHHYLTMKNTETEVIRGDQQMAIEELYALLLHTSATHAGFEFSILPWSTRDFGMNMSPHGWFAAKFRALLRNMLVREQDDQLHLLSCVSSEWVKSGEKISISLAPTYFGQVNFALSCEPEAAALALNNQFIENPKELILHLPWFMEVSSIQADGKSMPVKNSMVSLPVETRRVEIKWRRKTEAPSLSYQTAVDDYKREYRRRYEEFLMKGN